MSYCVHCGVELDCTAAVCPLCHTPVADPKQPVDTVSPRPFPTRREEVAPISRRALGGLVTAMLGSVSLCCGLLNLFFHRETAWSLYVIGAAAMLWLWTALPLFVRKLHLLLRLAVDVAAVALYVYLIALSTAGVRWFTGLAAPIIVWIGANVLFLGLVLRVYHRSILTSITIVVGSVGVFLFGLEYLIDRWVGGVWEPSWSLVVLAVCVGLVIPLIVVRRVPSLREEARRRFHL